MYKISESSLDVFHIAFLIRYFFIREPSPHPVGWWSSMSSLLMFITYNKSLFFCGNYWSAYGFNLLLLSDVLLNTVKIYQPRNLCNIFMIEVSHGFTLACNQRQYVNHSISMILTVRHFPPLLKVHLCACQSSYWLIYIIMEGE